MRIHTTGLWLGYNPPGPFLRCAILSAIRRSGGRSGKTGIDALSAFRSLLGIYDLRDLVLGLSAI
jgi:hypothetical protein